MGYLDKQDLDVAVPSKSIGTARPVLLLYTEDIWVNYQKISIT